MTFDLAGADVGGGGHGRDGEPDGGRAASVGNPAGQPRSSRSAGGAGGKGEMERRRGIGKEREKEGGGKGERER